mmetsp:Transcript_23990/g.26628  ORF Transcript_23990/g.26628 Transcript_23990/m.26628 type:complete len:175 (-) Transcript_23990:121-645(-)|eukprot:CAMPEP_0168509366 /NCGR_PEP_ID=MMETSP0405-20121227/728_1 /TAXON_ID=498012 /ORGANISM="Trichosphaerium sp, Strain Am-I-7 wt" /LENGTH=174 /DNA_ID=CAMNT_0008526801 /DNA_START=1 /DNA_END=525 /DNA_ORIENTATION=+
MSTYKIIISDYALPSSESINLNTKSVSLLTERKTYKAKCVENEAAIWIFRRVKWRKRTQATLYFKTEKNRYMATIKRISKIRDKKDWVKVTCMETQETCKLQMKATIVEENKRKRYASAPHSPSGVTKVIQKPPRVASTNVSMRSRSRSHAIGSETCLAKKDLEDLKLMRELEI